MSETPGKRRVGRPRSPEKDSAILAATARLLLANGFARLTLDEVAAEANVSKSTIHLRWRTKADLVTAAIASVRQVDVARHHDDVRSQCIAVMQDLVANVRQVGGMALLGTCLAEERYAPDLMQLFRERVVLPRRQILRRSLHEGQESGDIRADADLDAVESALLGSFYANYLADRPMEEGWEGPAVDVVLQGVATHQGRQRYGLTAL